MLLLCVTKWQNGQDFKLVSTSVAGGGWRFLFFVLGVCCSDSCCGRQTGASLKLNDDGGVFSVVPNLVHKALVYVSNLVYLLNNDSDSGALVYHCRFFYCPCFVNRSEWKKQNKKSGTNSLLLCFVNTVERNLNVFQQKPFMISPEMIKSILHFFCKKRRSAFCDIAKGTDTSPTPLPGLWHPYPEDQYMMTMTILYYKIVRSK